MRPQDILLAAALLAQSAYAARYDVTLYSSSSCTGETKACSNIKKKTCCSDGGKTYQSAKVIESGSDTCDDELRIYKARGEEYCDLSLGQADDAECLKASKKEITGAMVYESGFFKRDNEPVVYVKPDEYRYDNGTTRYTILLDSPEGRMVDSMEQYEDRIAYAVAVGTPSLIEHLEKRAGCKPAKKKKPPKKALLTPPKAE